MIKNIIIAVETICIVVLVSITMNLYNRIPGEGKETGESELGNLQESIENKEIEDKTENFPEKLNFKFDQEKMKLKEDSSIYEEVEYYTNYGITISLLQDNKVELYTNPEDEVYQSIFPNETEIVSNQEIAGFSSNIVDVYYAHFGNGLEAPKILFLLEDGSVEYVDSQKMIETKNYTSAGKIKELSNIVRFENIAVAFSDENGQRAGGALTVVAIDKDGYSYDLNNLEF